MARRKPPRIADPEDGSSPNPIPVAGVPVAGVPVAGVPVAGIAMADVFRNNPMYWQAPYEFDPPGMARGGPVDIRPNKASTRIYAKSGE